MARIKDKNKEAGEHLLKEISSKIKELIEQALIESKDRVIKQIGEISSINASTNIEFQTNWGSLREYCRAYEIIKENIEKSGTLSTALCMFYDPSSYGYENALRLVGVNPAIINDLLNRWKIKPVFKHKSDESGQTIIGFPRLLLKDPTKTGARSRDEETRLILSIKKKFDCTNKDIEEIFKDAGIPSLTESAIKKRIQSYQGEYKGKNPNSPKPKRPSKPLGK